MSGQGESKDPWSDLARQLGEEAAEGETGAAAGEAIGEWSETRPFLPEETKREGLRKLARREEKRPRFGREKADAAKAARSAKSAKAAAEGAKEATGVVGRVLAGVAAHTILAGTAIVVCVVAFGATGVMLLKSTEAKDHDDVATVDLGGDKSGTDESDLDSSGDDGVRAQAGDDGSGKASAPPEAPPPSDPGTTTTTRPRPTPTPTPGAPPPPDPTPEPTPEPTPAPSIGGFSRDQGQWCGDQRSRAVTFSWSSSHADSATLTRDGEVIASGLPATGSHTVNCVARVGAPIDSTWHLQVIGPGGTADSSPDLRITR